MSEAQGRAGKPQSFQSETITHTKEAMQALGAQAKQRWGSELHSIVDEPDNYRSKEYQAYLATLQRTHDARGLTSDFAAHTKREMQEMIERFCEQTAAMVDRVAWAVVWEGDGPEGMATSLTAGREHGRLWEEQVWWRKHSQQHHRMQPRRQQEVPRTQEQGYDYGY